MPTVRELMSQNISNAAQINRAFNQIFYFASAYDIFPDGTDVTNKLQELVNLANSEGRYTIVFPPGEYFVTSIVNEGNIVYFGDGASFTGGYGRVVNSLKDYLSIDAQLSEKVSKGELTINVKDYGAKGDGTVYDNEAVQTALDSLSATGGHVFFPRGSYWIDAPLNIPPNVILEGEGNSTLIFSPTAIDAILVLNDSCTVKNMHLNGNAVTSKAIRLNGDYAVIEHVYYQYCTYGIYNNGKDVHRIMQCNSDNTTYSIYTANRFINCVIDGHSSNGDGYFFYATYTDQQPQGIRIINCPHIFGTTTGCIFFEKDAYEVIIENNMFDGIVGNVIHIGTGPHNSQFKISNNFIASANSPANNGAVNIRIGEGTEGVFITNNTITLAPQWGVYAPATSEKRSSNIHIAGNTFNDNNRGLGTGDIFLDSTDNVRIISNNLATGTGSSVVTAGTNGNPFKIKMIANKFATLPTITAGDVVARDSLGGYITQNEGTGVMNNGSTSVTINHGLSVTPNKVWVTPKGNLGSVWVTNITSSQFTVNCASAQGSSTGLSWKAEL